MDPNLHIWIGLVVSKYLDGQRHRVSQEMCVDLILSQHFFNGMLLVKVFHGLV